MISFELTNPNSLGEMEIYLDKDGLAELLAQLKLLSDGKTDHFHMMAESWGGDQLRETPIQRTSMAMKHVKVKLV